MKSVCVLLSTYNGEHFLKEQLESLFCQKEVNVDIFIRDDGSKDRTSNLLDDYKKCGVLTWYTGENLGPAKSFLDLVKNAPDSEYYAFCDQDDVWLPSKLSVALTYLDDTGPSLYLSNYQMVDAALNKVDTPLNRPQISFPLSLISNCATGCTMVFNKKLLEVLRSYIPDKLMMHDSWTLKTCLAVGGNVYFDENSYILYRQHSANVVGGKGNLLKKWKRRIREFKNPPRYRYNEAMSLACYGDMLTDEAALVLSMLKDYYRKSMFYRMRLSHKYVFKSNKLDRNIVMRLSFLLKQF